VASAPTEYRLTWSRFDNQADADIGPREEMRTVQPSAQAPAPLLTGAEYLSVTIAAIHPDFPVWERPIKVYFRRGGTTWQTVGLDRLP
jgi:hypothetical protein